MNTAQKILLSLLECYGGELSSTDMQKYLFLFCQQQSRPSYHFLPYKYGCFSFNAYNDKRKLVEKGILENSDIWKLAEGHNGFLQTMPYSFRKYLISFKDSTIKLKGNELIRYIYLNYPYFAINSEIRSKVLNKDELTIIEQARPINHETVLFTYGYEGKSIEEYVNTLILQDIKIICDVRKNPLSRKYGFSKKTLGNAAKSVGIKYQHFPELGIDSAKRSNLRDQNDYDKLFDEYGETVISNATASLNNIIDLVEESERVVLLCFEENPRQCHRTIIANAIKTMDNFHARITLL